MADPVKGGQRRVMEAKAAPKLQTSTENLPKVPLNAKKTVVKRKGK